MNVLVPNAGSSSLEFQLIRTDAARMASDADERLARGVIALIDAGVLRGIEGTDGAVSGLVRVRVRTRVMGREGRNSAVCASMTKV